jgi:hypothetical protein
MLHRLNAPVLVTVAAVLALGVAMVTLRDAAPEIVAAVIVVLVMIAGAGVGATVISQSPRH